MRFGLIIPSSNTTMEAEFWKMALGFASVHAARMRLQKITVDDLEEMEGQMLEAAVSLADAGVDVIGYGCTSGSLFKGRDHDREIERKITEKTGIPAVATARAVVEALNELQVTSVCVATPYVEEINDLEKSFLEQNGIEVLRIQGLNIVQNTEVGKKEPRVVFELAKEVYVPETQGIFISCTNFRTLDVISELEKELGVPVISSNTATFWAMMKKMGMKRRLDGYGKLFLI
jgi:maleate isomerase